MSRCRVSLEIHLLTMVVMIAKMSLLLLMKFAHVLMRMLMQFGMPYARRSTKRCDSARDILFFTWQVTTPDNRGLRVRDPLASYISRQSFEFEFDCPPASAPCAVSPRWEL